MNFSHLDDMKLGWFVGDFTPNILQSKDVEVGVKYYQAGDEEARHVHKVATEITVVVSGTVKMCDREFPQGSIIVLEPGDPTAFSAITDAVTVVVKSPSVAGDKYVL